MISPRPLPSSAPDVRGASILVVDDETVVRKLICRYLMEEGHVCHDAGSVDEALRFVRTHRCDLIVTDICMPERSGLELLRLVRQQFGDRIALLAITGTDDPETAQQAIEAGASAYLSKPINRNEVVANVIQALDLRRARLAQDEYARRLEQNVAKSANDIKMREAEIILRLVTASEYRHDETGSHIRRIGLFAAALAHAAGWTDAEVGTIRLAGAMHDIGKIGVPDIILLKPGKLTPQEFLVVQRHAEIGAHILGGSDIALLRMACEIALHHHEKYNGTGYPSRLVADQIPECARIVAIADAYDALVTDRVYRKAYPEEQALDIMTADNESHFDPVLFEHFKEVLPELRRIRRVVEAIDTQTHGSEQGADAG